MYKRKLQTEYLYKQTPKGGTKYWVRGLVDGCYVLRFWRKSKKSWTYVVEHDLFYCLQLGLYTPWKGKHESMNIYSLTIVTPTVTKAEDQPYLLIRYRDKL